MSRFRKQTPYGHGVEDLGYGNYRLSWTMDRYVKGSRLRFPTAYTRDTDHQGAIRFAKRWGLTPRNPRL
jgi:hypothetical protein